MKKVRFESPVKAFNLTAMHESECHSPRPLLERQVRLAPLINFSSDYRPVPFSNDSIQRFECSNSSPYPGVSKTSLSNINKTDNLCSPNNELDLSILDSTSKGPRTPRPSIYLNTFEQKKPTQILTPLENRITSNPISPNVLSKNEDFFLRRDNVKDIKLLHNQINRLHLDKENNPMLKKTEIMKLGQIGVQTKVPETFLATNVTVSKDNICQCHHCNQIGNSKPISHNPMVEKIDSVKSNDYNICPCAASKPITFPMSYCPCHQPINNFPPMYNCNNRLVSPAPTNAVDKKSWVIEKMYKQSKNTECLDLETQNNVTKEKREPTVADLFKIIKLQNEQLQLLQEKVDKFISSNNKQEGPKRTQPVCAEVDVIGTEQKISIGVMTSFEMFRTSTIINKEVVKQREAQIQCNRSQISIKEVVSKTHPSNLNFLDGITPVKNQEEKQKNNNGSPDENTNMDNYFDDKTLNEMSLYNVQVDNAITPQLSPEQSLYLDVRDYSDSDASSDDQSNVGWTYYNKVMTHVNGILQESDMPSSASALYRNAKQKCMQMQIDKTNISVAKRVTFGDDPLGVEQVIHAATTDTSLKMNQLAAKYLKNAPSSNTPSPKPTMPSDMSLATRKYMEKHKIIQGTSNGIVYPQVELPKFLDITALKQQPKLL